MMSHQQTPFQAPALLQSKVKPVPSVLTHHVQQHVVHETAACHLTPIPESAARGRADGPEIVVTSFSCCLLLLGSGLIISSSLTDRLQTFALSFLLSSKKTGLLSR